MDRVYREPELRDATWAVDPSGDDYSPEQSYLKGGTTGPHKYTGINVDNAAVWGKFDGAGIGFVDLETGWNPGHEDLPAAAFPLFNVNRYTKNHPSRGNHGTAVLGVVVGVDNERGIIGIAPKANLRRLVSRVRCATDKWDLVNAILAALDRGVMAAGDVLLIEVETVINRPVRGYPVEIVDHWFDAIRLAAGNGMIVVEAAGNGYYKGNTNVGRNLDQLERDWPDAPTWRSMNRKRSDKFVDSGAIMVSACTSAVAPDGAPPKTHRRMAYATFGSRIDCYAWGEDVFTAGSSNVPGANPKQANVWYTDNFTGTSSAAAIIAGAALLVQQMHVATRAQRASPVQVRALLSDRSLGVTVVDQQGSAEIGVMPDLAAIAAKLGAVPGDEPS
ncbi:MAG: S8 family serine peptidase [Gemmatimonadales bacterium]|nr:S8 family serine peptidase [Gemmatimonadales bacterium]